MRSSFPDALLIVGWVELMLVGLQAVHNGELTARFAAKAALVAGVAGLVFAGLSPRLSRHLAEPFLEL
ncbi:hypothetical protein VB636_08815, partial [Paracoccus sp. APAP_BH8]